MTDPNEELVECSTSLDIGDLTRVLGKLQALVTGLSSEDVGLVARTVEQMQVGDEREWTFEVRHAARRAPLVISVFMDDIDAPDFYARTTPALANAIDLIFGELEAAAAAERIHEEKRAVYEAPPPTKIVDGEAYPHLDLAFYRKVTSELEAQGFTRLGDIEANPSANWQPTFLRVLASADGVTQVFACNLRPRDANSDLPFELKTIDLETELSDGTFVVTTNAYLARHNAQPPAIRMEYMKAKTSAKALLRRHAARVTEQLATSARSTVPIASLADALASQDRFHKTKLAFERDRSYGVSREELKAMAGDVDVENVEVAAEQIADAMSSSDTQKR